MANDTDEDAGDQMVAFVYSIPALGSLVFQEDGSFSYFPNSNATGTDTLTYKAYDGEAFSEITSVTIYVSAITQRLYIPIVVK